MWLFFSNSMLSIVRKPNQKPGTLTVRARAAGDIARVFPGFKVEPTPKADYAYRAVIPRGDIALALTSAVEALDYDNFKDSVTEQDRHDAYVGVWDAMWRFQQGRTAGLPRVERDT